MLKKLRLLLLALLIVALSVFFASRFKSYAPPALAVVGQLNVGAQTDLLNIIKSKTIYESDLYFGADQNAGVLTSTGYILVGQPVARGTAVAPVGFLIDANGRMRGTGVNIGTTATNYKLEVLDSAVSHGNAARFQGNVGIGFGVTDNGVPLNILAPTPGAPAFKINDSNNKPVGVGVNNGNMLFTTNNGVADNTQMTIKNDGNVGVGTTDALAKLYVSNGSNPGDIMSLRGGTSGYNMIFGLDDSQAYIYNNSSSRKLTFGTNSQKSGLVLDTNGNVGVGGATSPGAKLDVGGSVSMISNNSGNINIIPSGSTIFSQGNVGVGTASPGNRLEVVKTLVNGGGFDYNISSKLYGTTVGTLNTAVRGDNQVGVTAGSGTNSGVWGSSSPTGQTTQSVNIGVLGTGGSGFGYALPGGTLAGIGIGVLGAGSNFDIYAPSGSPSYFYGNVGIGSSAPDSSLDLGGGSISSSANGQRTYHNVYQYADSNSTDTGTLAIVMPQGWTNTMMRVRISGYDYGAAGSWEVVVGGYNYQPSVSWVNYTAEIRGTAPFNQVRLGYNGTKMVILLGTTTTTWHYPKFTVTEFIAGHQNINGWGSGWSSSFIVSEAGISSIVTPAINMYTATNGYVGIGTTSPNTRLSVVSNMELLGSTNPWMRFNNGTSGQYIQMDANGYLNLGGVSGYINIHPTTGNVGIGSGAPNAKLDIVPSSGVALNIGRIGGQPSIKSTADWLIMDSNTQPAALNYWSAQPVILAQGGGNVGIGTTSPKSKFSVSFGNSDMLNVYQPADNQLGIQTTIDGSSIGDGYAYADTNYLLRLQPYVGSVVVGQPGLFPYGKLEISQVNPSGWSGNLKAFRAVSPDTNYWLSLDSAGCAQGGVCWTFNNNVGQLMTFQNNGNIGIGTTDATSKVTVIGGGISANSPSVSAGLAISAGPANSVNSNGISALYGADAVNYGAGSRIRFGGNGTNATAFIIQGVGDQQFMKFANGVSGAGIIVGAAATTTIASSATRMAIYSPGNGLYEDWPAWGGGLATWDIVAASIKYSGLTQRSDIRLKKDVHNLEDKTTLEKVMELRPVSFYWKDKSNGEGMKFGFIAQDAMKVFPNLVLKSTDKNGYYSFDYTGLISPVVKVVQEQQRMLADLQDKFSMDKGGDLTVNGEEVFKTNGKKVTDVGGFAKLTVGLFKAGTAQVKKLFVDGVDIVKKIAELEEKIGQMQQKIDGQDKKIQELEQKLTELTKSKQKHE